MTEALPAELMPGPAPFDPEDIPPGELDVADDPPLPEAIEAWRVANNDDAEWAMRLLAAYEAEDEAITAQADAYIDKVQEWAAKEHRRLSRRIDYFRDQVEVWALVWRERTGRPTLALPSGVVKTSHHRPRIQIADPHAVLDWAERTLTGDELDDVAPRKLSLSGVQDACTIANGRALYHGEIVPGLTVTDEWVSSKATPA